MPDPTTFTVRKDSGSTSAAAIQKWGGVASFLLAAAFIVPSMIHLVGNLREANGPLAYDLADLLFGPVWAASLVLSVYALRERIGERAQQRTTLALLAALLAAGAMISVACIRSANRHYHLTHPELHLEMNTTVLVVWATLVSGVTAAGLHFLGWSMVLLGWAGWSTRRLPRPFSGLYLLVGAASLFAYLLPDVDVDVMGLGMLVSIWQGIVLLRDRPGGTQAPESGAFGVQSTSP